MWRHFEGQYVTNITNLPSTVQYRETLLWQLSNLSLVLSCKNLQAIFTCNWLWHHPPTHRRLYKLMAGKHFSKKHPLLPNQIAYGGHQMKAKLPLMSLACVMNGYPLIHKKNFDINFRSGLIQMYRRRVQTVCTSTRISTIYGTLPEERGRIKERDFIRNREISGQSKLSLCTRNVEKWTFSAIDANISHTVVAVCTL